MYRTDGMQHWIINVDPLTPAGGGGKCMPHCPISE